MLKILKRGHVLGRMLYININFSKKPFEDALIWFMRPNIDLRNSELQNGEKHNGESQKVE